MLCYKFKKLAIVITISWNYNKITLWFYPLNIKSTYPTFYHLAYILTEAVRMKLKFNEEEQLIKCN